MEAGELENHRYSRELETAFEAAREAGEIINSYAGKGFDSWEKYDASIVTEADIESQETIVEKLNENFPGDGLLGEEEHLTPGDEDRVWVIDPLDGTFNFGKGFPFYCVSIALEVNQQMQLGVVHLPETSIGCKTFFAAKDYGAFAVGNSGELEDGNRISVNSQETVEDSVFFLTTFDIYGGEFELEKQLFTELVSRRAVQRQLGACAVEMCFLASGKASFQVNPIAKKMDYAAGKVIIEEAGGECRVRNSRFPDSFEIVASNGELQEQVEEVVGERFQ